MFGALKNHKGKEEEKKEREDKRKRVEIKMIEVVWNR